MCKGELFSPGMIATLPMYDWPEVRAAVDAWWRCLSRHAGLDLPLIRGLEHGADWADPVLVFSQTCGYPFTHAFSGMLAFVATPHYAADGCEGPEYCSFIMAREKQPLSSFRGATAAINGPDSMSGMLALKLVAAPYAQNGQFFARTLVSGAHRESLKAVQQGRADICAIDSVCIGLARRYRPDLLEGLVEVGRSPRVPGLPFVTRKDDPVRWRKALAATLADEEAAEPAAALLLQGFSVLPLAAYDRILELERGLEASGGVQL